jgi:hypothetical protein
LLEDKIAEHDADNMIDCMRGHQVGFKAIKTQRANTNRTRSRSEALKYENHLKKYSYESPPSHSYREIEPSYQEELLFPMDEDMQFIETPAQRRAIQEDMSPLNLRWSSSAQRQQSHDMLNQNRATVKAPAQQMVTSHQPTQQHAYSRASPQAQQPPKPRTTPRARIIYVDRGETTFPPRYFREDDEGARYHDNDNDGYHDISGFEDGTQHYNDFRGEYDGGYGDF